MKKKFDAVGMVRRIRDQIYRETRRMKDDEFLAYIRKGAQQFRKKSIEHKVKIVQN